jgi:hypothetical protein
MTALERLEEVATPLGLWGEHVEPALGEQRGNFPQLFPHAGFIAAAAELKRARSPLGLPQDLGSSTRRDDEGKIGTPAQDRTF